MVPESDCGELLGTLVGSGNGRSVGINAIGESVVFASDESSRSSRLAALFLLSPFGGYRYLSCDLLSVTESRGGLVLRGMIFEVAKAGEKNVDGDGDWVEWELGGRSASVVW